MGIGENLVPACDSAAVVGGLRHSAAGVEVPVEAPCRVCGACESRAPEDLLLHGLLRVRTQLYENAHNKSQLTLLVIVRTLMKTQTQLHVSYSYVHE